MHKNILIAGLVAAISLGAGLQAQAQTSAPPSPPKAGADRDFDGPRDGRGGHRFHDGRGFRGGPGGFRGRGMRQPPTAEEVQKRNAALFARVDANKDGRVTFDEFRAAQERRRLERQREMFQRFTGQQDSVTLDQLNARSLERLKERGERRGPGRGPEGRTPPAAR